MHPDEFVSLAAPRMFVSRADREGEAQQQQAMQAIASECAMKWQAIASERAEQQEWQATSSGLQSEPPSGSLRGGIYHGSIYIQLKPSSPKPFSRFKEGGGVRGVRGRGRRRGVGGERGKWGVRGVRGGWGKWGSGGEGGGVGKWGSGGVGKWGSGGVGRWGGGEVVVQPEHNTNISCIHKGLRC
jgi:hypothetical protein